MKTCFRVIPSPRTGDPIEVHDASEWIYGPLATLEIPGGPRASIVGQLVCVYCGHVMNWASERITTGDPTAEIEAVRKRKPTSIHHKTETSGIVHLQGIKVETVLASPAET